MVLAGRRIEERQRVVEWALEARLVVEIDSLFVPLATADPELLREFESERLQQMRMRPATRQALPVIQLTGG